MTDKPDKHSTPNHKPDKVCRLLTCGFANGKTRLSSSFSTHSRRSKLFFDHPAYMTTRPRP
ncbi:hypothetical protein, partial [Mycobacterium intracellulare]|uniref:hypothetical protein n=1 Tax=Mycobacterium intracellulare TaxID=1767 RepID=UPI001C6136C0